MTPPAPFPAPSQTISRVLLYIAASLCFVVAAALIIAAGLPDRAALTALYTLPDGRAVAPEIGAFAPPLELTSVDGETVSLDSLRGRVVVLNYWATWCAPCQIEMPALQTLTDRYPTQVSVWGINAGERPELIRAWQKRFSLRFPLLLDPQGVTATIYRLRGQPTTVIVAPDGRIRDILYGPADLAALERAVIALLPDMTERNSP